MLIEKIHKELHERVALQVESPSRIRHSAYLLPEEGPEFRDQVRQMFMDILTQLGISPQSVRWGQRAGFCEHTFPDGSRLRLNWELHTEFYSYTTLYLPGEQEESPASPYSLPTFPDLGEKLVDLDLMVISGTELREEDRAFLWGGNIYGGTVSGGEASIYTTFQINEYGQARYVIIPGSLKPGRLGRLIKRVVDIENYFHLVLMPMQEYRENVGLLRDAEQRIARYSEDIAADLSSRDPITDRENRWLVYLTREVADLIRLTERLRYRFFAANSYHAIFEERMHWLREEPPVGFAGYREFLTARVNPAIRSYQNFIERADVLTNQITVLGNMMRTRVNMNMEQQGLKTMDAMNRRAALQLLMQRTVESLSLIVLSYYMTGLAGYVLKAVEKTLPLPGGATIWSAFTIPLWLGVAFLITHRVKKKIEKVEGK